MQLFKEGHTGENGAKHIIAEIISAELNTTSHHSIPAIELQLRRSAGMLGAHLRSAGAHGMGSSTPREQLGSPRQLGAQALPQRSHRRSVQVPRACADTWRQGCLSTGKAGIVCGSSVSCSGEASSPRARSGWGRRRGRQQTFAWTSGVCRGDKSCPAGPADVRGTVARGEIVAIGVRQMWVWDPSPRSCLTLQQSLGSSKPQFLH